jgi:hypothetical protein
MRLLRPICLLLALAGVPFSGVAAAARISGVAPVVALASARAADLVILGGGYDADFRPGMVCRVTRGTTLVAEILLVELRPAACAAVILSLEPKQSIQAGDLARMKTLKT